MPMGREPNRIANHLLSDIFPEQLTDIIGLMVILDDRLLRHSPMPERGIGSHYPT
jgi:hypothetical protein